MMESQSNCIDSLTPEVYTRCVTTFTFRNTLMKRVLLTCAAAIGVCVASQHAYASPPAGTDAAFVVDSIYSPALHRSLRYQALVPARKDTSLACPGLLILHGFGGDEQSWMSSGDLMETAQRAQVVIIAPDGRNSWYVDSATDTLQRFEEAFVVDLLPRLLFRFHLDSMKIGVAGFSMGGFGALSLGLRHPGAFAFVGALSASLDIPMDIPSLERNNRSYLRPSLEAAFGRDTLRWRAYDLSSRVAALDSSVAPYLYLASGIQDEFTRRVDYYHRFIALLQQRHFAYEYHETPGHHNWAYCRQEIGPLVQRMIAVLRHRE